MSKLKTVLLILAAAGAVFAMTRAVRADEKKPLPAARDIANYKTPPEGNIEDRVYTTPKFILDYYAEIDKDLIPADKPYRAYDPTKEEMSEIRAAINGLPKEYKEKISPRLLGIYFVDNLVGSGWSEWIQGPNGRRYYIMIFNSKVLHMTASEWITSKERSVFIAEPGYELNIDIGGGTGFRYIFAHEITHVYDYIAGVTPGEGDMDTAMIYESRPGVASMKKKYPFIYGVWDKFTKPASKYAFAGHENVTFYGLGGGPKIKISDAPQYYEKLRGTPFVSLYGSLNWMEDFAEFMAAYMNVEELKNPWTLTITKDGKTVYRMEGVFERKLSKERLEFAAKLCR